MNTIAFNELVAKRRSTFPDQFIAGKKVEEAIIKQVLINANWAPNHGMEQPWHFTVFTGGGLQALANFQAALYKEESGDAFQESKFQKLLQQPLKASHIIALGMKRSIKKAIPEIEDIEAVACAVQNIYLSVTAYGLGGYWTTGGVTYMDRAKYFFNLGEHDRLLGFFYIGHIAVPSTEGRRKPVEERVEWRDAL